MKNFDRQYRLAAGKAGSQGFEIGGDSRPLHISFSVEKADTDSANTAKVSLWNLSPAHKAELNKDDCVVALRAGYGSVMPLIFAGGSLLSLSSSRSYLTNAYDTKGRVVLQL